MTESTYTPIEVTIPLAGGRTLLIQQNCDPMYRNEVFIGYGDEDGVWIQDLAVVRQYYESDPETFEPIWNHEKIRVGVYGDSEVDDITNDFIIDERKWEEL